MNVIQYYKWILASKIYGSTINNKNILPIYRIYILLLLFNINI